MKYGILRIKGKQYRVSEGDEILVGKISEKEVKAELLMFVDGDKVEIGKPVIEKNKVKVSIMGEEKGEKINGLKYKSKSRYRKKFGFRPQYSRVKIEKLSL